MKEREETRAELHLIIKRLQDQVKELEHQRCSLPEDTLTLAILERAPFTVWACRRNFDIVLWNRRCEERYSCSREDAIGKNFFELFVHEHERDQAKQDCIKIIDDNKVFVNFIADDHDATGKQIRVLTNCFRIWDEKLKEWLQAEIGVDISDFQTSEEQHRTIKEVGMKMQQMKAQAAIQELALRKQETRLTIRDSYFSKIRAWEQHKDTILNITNHLHPLVDEDGRKTVEDKVDLLSKIRAEIESRFNAIDRQIFNVTELQQLEALREPVSEFVLWHPVGL